jgi:primosomal protein N' (replication factor Y)
VTLVGVINADTSLHFPDFRAAERTFQLVTQVAGRTGRGDRGGRVIVQTYSPDHPVILASQRHDYDSFVAAELPVRREFGYPPFAALVRIVARGPALAAVEQFAEHVTGQLRAEAARAGLTPRIMGPVAAPIPRLRGHFRSHVLLSHEELEPLVEVVRRCADAVTPPEHIIWTIDVDPLDML